MWANRLVSWCVHWASVPTSRLYHAYINLRARINHSKWCLIACLATGSAAGLLPSLYALDERITHSNSFTFEHFEASCFTLESKDFERLGKCFAALRFWAHSNKKQVNFQKFSWIGASSNIFLWAFIWKPRGSNHLIMFLWLQACGVQHHITPKSSENQLLNFWHTEGVLLSFWKIQANNCGIWFLIACHSQAKLC